MNSPVTASKPTWMVCSKSDGEEISGLSLSRSFFLPPAGKSQGGQCADQPLQCTSFVSHFISLTFLWGKHWDDLVSGLPLLRYRRQWPRAVIGWLWVLGSSSLAAHPDRGGGGLVLTHSAVTHLHTRTPAQTRRDDNAHEKRSKSAACSITRSLLPVFFFFFQISQR